MRASAIAVATALESGGSSEPFLFTFIVYQHAKLRFFLVSLPIITQKTKNYVCERNLQAAQSPAEKKCWLWRVAIFRQRRYGIKLRG